MIDYGKVAILGVICAIVFGSGWWMGYSRYLEYKKSVEIAVKAQEEKVKSIRAQQELVTKGIEDEYNAKLALIRQYYANGVRQPSPSTLSNYGISTKQFDVSTAYSELVGNCAQTTLMLVELQKWINDQYKIK